MAEGERVASNIARQQSKFCQDSDPRFARFFKHQARQERFHNGVFMFAVRWISPKGVRVKGEEVLFDRFETELSTTLKQNDFSSCVLGLQVVLEAMGDAFLDTIDARMEKRDMGLERLRKTIRLQEEAHQDFGQRFLRQQAEINKANLKASSETQIAIIDDVIEAISSDLEALDLNPENYSNKVKQSVQNLNLW